MRELLRVKLARACTLSQFLDGIIDALEETRMLEPEKNRIGYVSGIVSSDGPDHIERNLILLQNYTDKVQKNFDIPAFCAGDIFLYNYSYEILDSHKAQNEDLVKFWHNVLGLGYVTDIFMTPDWVRSRGAKEELETAKTLEIAIHYLNNDGGLCEEPRAELLRSIDINSFPNKTNS